LGLLASKTVIYVTHQIEFLPAADLILVSFWSYFLSLRLVFSKYPNRFNLLLKVMKDGKITQAGKYQKILESGNEFMELVSAHRDALSALDFISLTELAASSSNQKIENKKIQNDKLSEETNPNVPKGQLVTEEEREKGKVGFWVYWKYITLAYNGALVSLVLLAQICFELFQIASNYWMAWAAPVSEDMAPPVNTMMLIYVFAALALGSSLCILVRALLLVTAGYKTATILFDKMHTSIFRAPMSFFDSTPSGRILNRVTFLVTVSYF
jgi:ABC transporter transmembrane region